MAAITDISQLDLTKTYTYADYLTWQFDELVELIKGHVWRKSPAPRVNHARYTVRLVARLANFLAGQRCEVFAAPVDVRLLKSTGNGDRQVATVVQPDVFVVCDPAKVGDMGITGAPDFIVEIVSPGSVAHDTKTKYDLYEENAVGEYWLVLPGEKSVTVYVLEGEQYQVAGNFYQPGPIPCRTLPGLALDWNDIFQAR